MWVREESGAESHVIPRRPPCQRTGVTEWDLLQPGFLHQQLSSLARFGFLSGYSMHSSEVSAAGSSSSRDYPPNAN